MYCNRCGMLLPDNANFCSKCGNNVSAVHSADQTRPVKSVKSNWVPNSGEVNPNPVQGYESFNPAFRIRCEHCYYEFTYHTYDLGHRSWYPLGFVYCPRCRKPLKHRMENEVLQNPPVNVPQNNAYMPPSQQM